MSWLARSIANSLKLDNYEDDDHYSKPHPHPANQQRTESDQDHTDQDHTDQQSSSPSISHSPSSSSSAQTTQRSVKEDLSELSKTLSRQFWGVASFLAPPPPSDLPNQGQLERQNSPYSDDSDEVMFSVIRSDLIEIGGKFRSGISKLSSNIAVSEISKIASNFLQLGSEEDRLDKYKLENVVGVTEEVVAFVRDISMHPETWLDFRFPDDDDFNEFDMSDAQQEHALAVEQIIPRLAALRIEICPGYISEECFWKIYFLLLHSRLSKHDAELLSTPEILEARQMLYHNLGRGTEAMAESNHSEDSPSSSNRASDIQLEDSHSLPSVPLHYQSESAPSQKSVLEEAHSIDLADYETQKHAVQSTKTLTIDKSAIEEGQGIQTKPQHLPAEPSRDLDDKSYDDWLKDENSELVGTSGMAIPLEIDEDVSFSDLEEDDDGDAALHHKKTTSGSDSSARDWVEVGRSSTDSVNEKRGATETKESSDWLDLDEIDVV